MNVESHRTATAVAQVVREHPILFSAPMVKAILAGRKTQTRRLVRWRLRSPHLNLQATGLEAGHYVTGHPEHGWVLRSRGGHGCWNDRTERERCRYGAPGDRLWVRETWQRPWHGSSQMFPPSPAAAALYDDEFYKSQGKPAFVYAATWEGPPARRWNPSIFMPRRAARILLEVTEVRVERLQAISEDDAKAEGVGLDDEGEGPARYYPCVACSGDPKGIASLCHPLGRGKPWRCVFANLWDSINGERAPWLSNPWVWAVSFRRLEP